MDICIYVYTHTYINYYTLLYIMICMLIYTYMTGLRGRHDLAPQRGRLRPPPNHRPAGVRFCPEGLLVRMLVPRYYELYYVKTPYDI